MDLGLRDKVVIVTGGGRGIGRAITEGLAVEGAVPVVISRSLPDEAFWAAITAAAPRALALPAELGDDARCAECIDKVRQRLGSVHALVNNAGSNDGVGLDAGPAAFRASLDTNLVHYYTMAHLLADDLRAARGAIVNISSKTAVTGQGGTSAYVAAKAGILGLTREWAAEFAKDDVRVNAVVVAESLTPLYERHLARHPDPAAVRAAIERMIPLGHRMTEPREIADTVLFLLSDRASHTTGQWVFPDGGYTHLDRALK